MRLGISNPTGSQEHDFNPRTRTECDNHARLPPIVAFWPFQSTHSYRVRLAAAPCSPILSAAISIHALVQSATPGYPGNAVFRNISIHALVQSATILPRLAGRDTGRFQSTHSYRVRPQGHGAGRRVVWRISIHALVQSATVAEKLIIGLKKFQSTHSYRVRPFNVTAIDFAGNISIHALVQSATILSTKEVEKMSRDFNPRTRTECDSQLLTSAVYDILDFNPRTRTECDHHRQKCGSTYCKRFQSTHSYRVRQRIPRCLVRQVFTTFKVRICFQTTIFSLLFPLKLRQTQ